MSQVPVCVSHSLVHAFLGPAVRQSTNKTNQISEPESCDAFVWVNIAMTCLFPWFRVSLVEIYTGKLSTTLLSHGSLYSCLATSVAWEPGGRTLHSQESARMHFAQKAGKDSNID